MSYGAPGNMDELSAPQLEAWNRTLSDLFAGQISIAAEEQGSSSGRAWLFNPIESGVAGTTEATISWTAFPKRISEDAATPREGWVQADADRNQQEEYCEWEVARDPARQNKVMRAIFTTEAEDYYHFLAKEDPALLLDLYRRHVSPDVEIADLLSGSAYDAQNRWNYPQQSGSRGTLMHMGQVNNSFEAAVNLAGVASWPRVNDDGQPVTGEQALIDCRPFGSERRHSDPHIGAEINALVRAGNEVSFADPVGLYIHAIDQSDWETPDGSDPADWYRVERGGDGHMLRVVFEAPSNDLILGDVLISGVPVRFGGQIAEKLQIRIRGIARPAAQAAPRLQCRRPAPSPEILPESLFERRHSRIP